MKKEYFTTTAFFLFFLIIIFILLQIFYEFIIAYYNKDDFSLTKKEDTKNKNKHNFNISRAFFITLNEEETMPMLSQSKQFLDIEKNQIFQAINGTQALHKGKENISLYTRYLMMISARHDHMQLSNTPMLGCLLSHINIWEMIQPGETVAIFEEDAYFDKTSTDRIIALSKDMQDHNWDLLMLMSGQFINSGTWKDVGQYAATCSNKSSSSSSFSFVFSLPSTKQYSNINTKTKKITQHSYYIDHEKVQNDNDDQNDKEIPNICSWFGTRGYLITYKGARKLLQHAYPIQVQIDALMGLVAAFEPDFKMYWSKQNIVHQRIFYISKIWDACLKCYLPTSISFYLSIIIFFIIFMFYSFIKKN